MSAASESREKLWAEQCAASLAASVRGYRARTWNDERAAAFEAGTARTRPARENPVKIKGFSHGKLTDPKKEARRARKRVLGGSSNLPPEFRGLFTDGERAVLAVISGEVKRHGVCDLSLKEIGDRAGVGRTLVQRAIGKALARDLISRTPRKKGPRFNDTSLVKIVSGEWLTWIRRAPAAAGGYATFATTSKNIVVATAEPRARAREKKGCPTKEAIELADDIACIAGHAAKLPESWEAAKPATVVQGWLDQLGQDRAITYPLRPADFIRQTAEWVISKKPDPSPPRSPRYFAPAIAAHMAKVDALRREAFAVAA